MRSSLTLALLLCAVSGCYAPRSVFLSSETSVIEDAQSSETDTITPLDTERSDATPDTTNDVVNDLVLVDATDAAETSVDAPQDVAVETAVDAMDTMNTIDVRDAMDVMDAMDAMDAMNTVDVRDAMDAMDAVAVPEGGFPDGISDRPAPFDSATPYTVVPPEMIVDSGGRYPNVTCPNRDFFACTGPTVSGCQLESNTFCGPSCTTCPAGSNCYHGRCCPSSTPACRMPDETIGNPGTHADENNCGACGRSCGRLAACQCGSCVCIDDYTACGGECVDVRSSNFHCGRCGNACAGTQVCIRGACVDAPMYPQSCAEARATTTERRQLFYQNNPLQPYLAYCDDLTTGPSTWLALRVDGNRNYVYQPYFFNETSPRGMTSRGPGLLTIFEKVRFDPYRDGILLQDRLHTVNEGWVLGHNLRFSLYYAHAVSCSEGASTQANADLLGNPFEFTSTWRLWAGGVGGALPRGTGIDLIGRGTCGGVVPDDMNHEERALYARVRYRAP